LTITPSNNLGIEYSRSDRYFGVIRTLTASLEFKYDQGNYIGGAQQLIDAFETNGIWAQASLLIQVRDIQNPMTYNNFFRGVADFSSIEIERNYVKMKFIESNHVQRLFKRDNINVNLNTLISLDGTAITDKGLYFDTYINAQNLVYGSKFNTVPISLTKTINSTNVDESYGLFGTIEYNDTKKLEKPTNTNNYKLYTATYAGTVTMQGILNLAIQVTYSGTGAFALWDYYASIVQYDSGDGFKDNFDIIYITGGGWALPHAGENENETISYNHDFTAAIDDYFILELKLRADNSTNPASSAYFQYSYDFNDIFINELAQTINSYATKTIAAFEAFTRCLQLITSNDTPLISELLQRTDTTPAETTDGEMSLVQITNGFKLRNIQRKDVSINFYNLFKSFDSIFNIGLWYNKITSQFEIKKKADFYDSSTIILELGEVSNLLITVDEENYFNEIEAGQKENVDFGELGGLEEFNVKTTFSTQVDKIQNTLDISSPYRTDGFGLIVARSEIEATTDDNKTDNSIFVIDCKRATSFYSFESITDEYFTIIDNVLSPDAKANLNFSPKRCILRNSNRISPCLEFKNSDLKFQESQFNSNLQTQKTGESAAITENENITFAELDDPLFSCLLYKFSYPVTALIIKALDANPHGLIEFYYKGVLKSGFLKRVSCDYPNKQGEWLLQKYS
jgi:hypothetical protein